MKNALIRTAVSLALLGSGHVAGAGNYSPPETCQAERQDLPYWGGSHYVRWSSVNKYALLNLDYTNRAKVDTHLDPTGDGVDIDFWSSEDNYIGDDHVSPLRNHAQHKYNFSSRGKHTIWVESYEDGLNVRLCAYTNVNAQRAPTVSTTKSQTIYPDRVNGTIYFSGTQDELYSKNAEENLPIQYEVQSKLITRWTGQVCDVVEESSSWQNYRSLSSSSSTTFSNIDCMIDYRIRSFDGKYYSDWSYETAIYSPQGGNTGGGTPPGGGSGGSPGSGGSCSGPYCEDEQ